jgi:hypothetical protein
MMSPSSGAIGWLASKVMTSANKITSQHVASQLKITKEDCVVELGPGNIHLIFFILTLKFHCSLFIESFKSIGNGWGLQAIATYCPSRVVAVEISERFRNEILLLKLPMKIELHDADARNMQAFLNASSVDKLMAINVVYFLDPLIIYAKELYRVMKPGGIGIVACKYSAQLGHSDVFKNKNIPLIVKIFQEAGFEVRVEKHSLGNPVSDYTSIEIVKKK